MSRKTVLVTGLSGFVGGHMLALQGAILHQYGYELIPVNPDLDLRDTKSADLLVRDVVPDAVIHLAAQSNVPAAFKDPATTIQINVMGTLYLLQALDRCSFKGRFLFVSSGDVYGMTDQSQLPILETQLPHPGNPYAVSKISAEALCLQWGKSANYDILVARPFNHIGPGQRPDFVVPSIAAQIAVAQDGDEIFVGDVDITRDFLDVRDVIHAYFSLLKDGGSGSIYNVCSGKERKVRDIAENLIRISGKNLKLVADPSRFRPSDQRRVCGSNSLIYKDTGWVPQYALEHTLKDILQSTLKTN